MNSWMLIYHGMLDIPCRIIKLSLFCYSNMEDSPAKNLPCQRRTQPNGNIFQSMAHFAGHPHLKPSPFSGNNQETSRFFSVKFFTLKNVMADKPSLCFKPVDIICLTLSLLTHFSSVKLSYRALHNGDNQSKAPCKRTQHCWPTTPNITWDQAQF